MRGPEESIWNAVRYEKDANLLGAPSFRTLCGAQAYCSMLKYGMAWYSLFYFTKRTGNDSFSPANGWLSQNDGKKGIR